MRRVKNLYFNMNRPASRNSKSMSMALVDRRPILRAMFNPQAIALIGATEAPDSVGCTLMENLLPFGRALYPINLKRNSVLGVKSFPNIANVPAAVDLAIIATPAITVPDVIGECAAAGVKGAVIISAGFRETGSAGRELEDAVLARRGGMRLLDPIASG